MTSPGPGYVAPTMALDRLAEEQLAARQRAEDLLEEGTVATLLVNPALALAGGILGGTVVVVLAWRAAWRGLDRPTLLELDRAYLRRRR